MKYRDFIEYLADDLRGVFEKKGRNIKIEVVEVSKPWGKELGLSFSKGRLKVHVRCLIDEMTNIGQIPNQEKIIATIRSREISACLLLQAKSQLKANYKDHANTIIENMDSKMFLGGTEQTTLKDLSQELGKETIDTRSTGESRGRERSNSVNYQKVGKELMTVDELFEQLDAATNEIIKRFYEVS